MTLIDQEVEGKTCHRTSKTRIRAIPGAPVPAPKERQRPAPNFQPEVVGSVCQISTFLDGRDAYGQVSDPETGLDDKAGAQGYVFLHANSTWPKKMVAVSAGESPVSVHMPTLQARLAPGPHKFINETCCESLPEDGMEDCPVLGQLTDNLDPIVLKD